MSRLFFFVPKIPEIRKKNDLASGGTEITQSVYQSINATSWNIKKNSQNKTIILQNLKKIMATVNSVYVRLGMGFLYDQLP